jgi:hypothetical protein
VVAFGRPEPVRKSILYKDTRVHAITAATKELADMRDRWLNAQGLLEADRKKSTLTHLYNAHPPWLDPAYKKNSTRPFSRPTAEQTIWPKIC